MIFIGKTFDFDAAHFLPRVHDGHKCKRMHGHTYRVEFRLQGPVDERGMICDYSQISDAWAPIHAALDHQTLNDVPGLENPTTEMLAPWILSEFKKSGLPVVSVRVYESSSTYCEAS